MAAPIVLLLRNIVLCGLYNYIYIYIIRILLKKKVEDEISYYYHYIILVFLAFNLISLIVSREILLLGLHVSDQYPIKLWLPQPSQIDIKLRKILFALCYTHTLAWTLSFGQNRYVVVWCNLSFCKQTRLGHGLEYACTMIDRLH